MVLPERVQRRGAALAVVRVAGRERIRSGQREHSIQRLGLRETHVADLGVQFQSMQTIVVEEAVRVLDRVGSVRGRENLVRRSAAHGGLEVGSRAVEEVCGTGLPRRGRVQCAGHGLCNARGRRATDRVQLVAAAPERERGSGAEHAHSVAHTGDVEVVVVGPGCAAAPATVDVARHPKVLPHQDAQFVGRVVKGRALSERAAPNADQVRAHAYVHPHFVKVTGSWGRGARPGQ